MLVLYVMVFSFSSPFIRSARAFSSFLMFEIRLAVHFPQAIHSHAGTGTMQRLKLFNKIKK